MSNYFTFLCLIFSCSLYGQDTFSTSGTWVCPPGITAISVECWGGGGGGGYAVGRTDGEFSIGTGGGGGCYSRKTFAVIPGNSYPVVVGSGGAGGNTTANDGQAGADSWFISATAVVAKGGGGGTGNVPSVSGVTPYGAAVGNGSVPGSIGDITYNGANGGVGRVNGSTTVRVWGGGGGSAGSMGNAPPLGNNQAFGGDCGSGVGGNGSSGGGGYIGSGAGTNGSYFGGGGSGAAVHKTQPPTVEFNGGNGGNGMIIISETTPLPVFLVYFKGSYTKDGSILFEWKVASQNTKSVAYSIEASSDGNNFVGIYSRKYEDKIPVQYSCNYRFLNRGEVFYRLKSVDETGAVKYSSIIQIGGSDHFDHTAIRFYPNPSRAISFIDFFSPAESNATVNIYNMNGKKVTSIYYALDEGENQLPVEISALKNGIYSLKCWTLMAVRY